MIRIRDLVKSYGDVRAVDGVGFDVPAGAVVGLLGPNGAGKSTTMKILTGFLRADGGQVVVAGRRVDPEDPASKEELGYLPETTPLYPRMRVGEYLDFIGRLRGLGRAARREAAERVLADCGLEGRAARRIGTLSKGYRQRVGLAQALLSDPRVLVLDEPTSGLDPGEITRIRALIERLGRTKTVLLSTHVLAEVQETCSRVIILRAGRVVADGETASLAEAERTALRVTLLDVDAAGAAAALAEVVGVEAVYRDAGGGTRHSFRLEVSERWRAAEAVSELARTRRWRLVELGHDLPSLERVFLHHTETRSAPESEEGTR